jgi:ABC-type transport system involved in Fe-S cluster assembly fused permease/ATPase subunit
LEEKLEIFLKLFYLFVYSLSKKYFLDLIFNISMFIFNKKWNFSKIIFLLLMVFPLFVTSTSINDDEQKRRVKRERAFDLLRLERALDDAELETGRIGERTIRRRL